MGRYLQLCRTTLEHMRAEAALRDQSPSPDLISGYELNERNEKSPARPRNDPHPQCRRLAGWAAGVGRLAGMPAPRTYPPHAWTQLVADAQSFLDRWAGQAAALGWQSWELFGCHRRAPWHRLDGRGLVLALQGRELAALTATEAVIRTARGAHLTHRRKPRDPLHPAERCLVWELG